MVAVLVVGTAVVTTRLGVDTIDIVVDGAAALLAVERGTSVLPSGFLTASNPLKGSGILAPQGSGVVWVSLSEQAYAR